jgi:hypothetical protein
MWEFWYILVNMSIYKWTQYITIPIILVTIVDGIDWMSNVTQNVNLHSHNQEGMKDKSGNFGQFWYFCSTISELNMLLSKKYLWLV